jgi:hypothetical protein
MCDPCLIIMSKAMKSSLNDENIKRINEPIYKKHYYSNSYSCLRYGIILQSGNKESNTFLNCKRRSFE